MKYRIIALTLVSLVLWTCTAVATCAQSTRTTTTTALGDTITDIIANDTNFTTLFELLQKAELTEMLNATSGNYTVLAPSNDAFNKINVSTLAELQNNATARKTLLYHIINKKRPTNELPGNGTLTPIDGLSLPYSVNGTKVIFGSGNNTAMVTKADINASNGVIHIIDGVLIPPAAAAPATASPSGGFLGLPGFEAIYAVAGLLAVAYLVIRRRK